MGREVDSSSSVEYQEVEYFAHVYDRRETMAEYNLDFE